MGRSSYKRLGDYIQPVDIRNKDNEVDKLVGLTIDKAFIDSVANTIGTDLSKYKIIEAEQFACSLMQVSRDGKMPIAMYAGGEKAILSPAYSMFEVIDKSELLPSYLMMWFRRSEFDREASFYAVGGVRGSLLGEDFLDFRLPIPAIEEQREIVAQYEAITRRIALNERICANLEETAQALYNKMFVQGIDPDNLPDGWHYDFLGNYVELSQGIQIEVEDQSIEKQEGYNRFVRIIDYTPNTTEPPRFVNVDNRRYYASLDDIVMIRYGDAGTVCRRVEGIIANNLFKVTPTHCLNKNFVYYFLRNSAIQSTIKSSAASSTMPAITHGDIKELAIVIPNSTILQEYDSLVNTIESNIVCIQTEIEKLKSLYLLTSQDLD